MPNAIYRQETRNISTVCWHRQSKSNRKLFEKLVSLSWWNGQRKMDVGSFTSAPHISSLADLTTSSIIYTHFYPTLVSGQKPVFKSIYEMQCSWMVRIHEGCAQYSMKDIFNFTFCCLGKRVFSSDTHCQHESDGTERLPNVPEISCCASGNSRTDDILLSPGDNWHALVFSWKNYNFKNVHLSENISNRWSVSPHIILKKKQIL